MSNEMKNPLMLSEEQVGEFKAVLEDVRVGWSSVRDLPSAFEALRSLPDQVQGLIEDNTKLRSDLNGLRKQHLAGAATGQVRWVNGVPFVGEDCARALAGLYVLSGERQGKLKDIVRDAATRDALLGRASEALGLETRA